MSPTRALRDVMSSGSTTGTGTVAQQIRTKNVPEVAAFFATNRRKKRRRFEAIPIFALRKAPHPRQSMRSTKTEANQRSIGHAVPIKDVPSSGFHLVAPESGPFKRGGEESYPTQPRRVPTALGLWEDSITNTVPSGEPLKDLSGFLNQEVVFVEIEAKTGQLIGKDTNTRLVLSVTTEKAISKNDAIIRASFRSYAEHCLKNKNLNKVCVGSQNRTDHSLVPGTGHISHSNILRARSPVRQLYELSQVGLLSLPPAITKTLRPQRSNTNPRITVDMQTGRTVAKMIKVRLANLDIYSPNTDHHIRVSVSVEKSLDGDDWPRLVEPHLEHIDLTQVTSETGHNEHELEVELSAAALRKNVTLMRDGQPNDFHKLVQGLTNSIQIRPKGL
ncbi:mRNA-capping enzyme subunit beta [Pseudocyphellaria aurata]|nr:mRNA-capping enzyme subunit beta [Pseudocyphellaria aurata]